MIPIQFPQFSSIEQNLGPSPWQSIIIAALACGTRKSRKGMLAVIGRRVFALDSNRVLLLPRITPRCQRVRRVDQQCQFVIVRSWAKIC